MLLVGAPWTSGPGIQLTVTVSQKKTNPSLLLVPYQCFGVSLSCRLRSAFVYSLLLAVEQPQTVRSSLSSSASFGHQLKPDPASCQAGGREREPVVVGWCPMDLWTWNPTDSDGFPLKQMNHYFWFPITALACPCLADFNIVVLLLEFFRKLRASNFI